MGILLFCDHTLCTHICERIRESIYSADRVCNLSSIEVLKELALPRASHSGAEYDIASLFRVSVLKLFCDQSMREKAWRSRKRGAQAT